MTIYIDSAYNCHTFPGEGLIAIETEFFNDKCRQYIEGYRFIPTGETWVRDDGESFIGEMIVPWRPYEVLAEFQDIYEEEQMNTTAEIAALVEEVYNKDMEVIENV